MSRRKGPRYRLGARVWDVRCRECNHYVGCVYAGRKGRNGHWHTNPVGSEFGYETYEKAAAALMRRYHPFCSQEEARCRK